MIAILCLIAVFVATYFIAKTANETGRSGILWGLLTLSVGLGFQLIIPICIGILVGIVLMATGTPPDQIESAFSGWWTMLLGIGTIVLSFVGIGLIMKQVSKIPEDALMSPVAPPPPPPSFS